MPRLSRLDAHGVLHHVMGRGIEAKNKREKRITDKFIEDKLPKFKQIFPEFKSCKILGGSHLLSVKPKQMCPQEP